MSERAFPPGIPAGSVPRIRSVTAAGVVYTVPASRRLHIARVWLVLAPAAASGNIVLSASAVVGEAAGTITLGALDGTANLAPVTLSIDTLDVPVPAAATVNLAVTGLAAAVMAAGFYAWEEQALPGAGLV